MNVAKAILSRSKRKDKKYNMTFYNKQNEQLKAVDFGAKGMSDFTIHMDEERRNRYLKRHSKDPYDPLTAG
jgi:hypothetical protein